MGPVSSPQARTGSRKRAEEAGPSKGEPRKKKKHDPQTKGIKSKNVTCERQVDKPTLEAHNDMVRAIEGHGLHFWFQAVEGFIELGLNLWILLKIAPAQGLLKLNIDGASKGNPGLSGGGAILGNQWGQFVLGGSYY
ncbi:unnamed protein product [Ilex paraguariensis]|uniref:Uncharacterized protein n=1 Tax=Ilex paraguariensis TaxID=185542 RepID=A0ABC8V4A8_9AQUA